MEIKQLKYFLQVCKDENFSKAAKNLFISQQGLSKAIKRLEEEINAPLFYRKITGIELTEYGRYLYIHAKRMVTEYDDLNEALLTITNNNEGRIKVGASYSFIISTPHIFNEFNQKFPAISIDLKEYTDYKCEEALLREEIDIGFIPGIIFHNDLNYRFLREQNFYAVVNKKNPLSKKNKLDFGDLKEQKIISVNDDFKIRQLFIKKCQAAGFDPNITITTQEMMVILNLCKANKGVGLTIQSCVDSLSNEVKAIPFSDLTFKWKVYLVTKKSRTTSHTAKKLINYVL